MCIRDSYCRYCRYCRCRYYRYRRHCRWSLVVDRCSVDIHSASCFDLLVFTSLSIFGEKLCNVQLSERGYKAIILSRIVHLEQISERADTKYPSISMLTHIRLPT